MLKRASRMGSCFKITVVNLKSVVSYRVPKTTLLRLPKFFSFSAVQ